MNIFFTSDSHFGSARTLELSKRPFDSVSQMDKQIINNWNSVVSMNDTVYHLGDFGDALVMQKLQGKSIKIIPGNYDTPEIVEELKKDRRVEIIKQQSIITINNEEFMLIHEPENGDVDYFHLFGHIHKLQMVKKNGLNTCVDLHHFTPLGEEDILFYRNAILKHYDNNVFMQELGKQRCQIL